MLCNRVEKVRVMYHTIFSAIYVLEHQLYIGHFTDESLTLHCNGKKSDGKLLTSPFDKHG